MRLLVLASLLAGCFPPVGLSELATTPLHAVPNPTIDPDAVWPNELAAGVAIWNAAIVARGCPPVFRVTDDPMVPSYRVTLYAWADWPFEDRLIGITFGGRGSIHVRNRKPADPNLPTIVHELGHALGLSHDENPASVMAQRILPAVHLGTYDARKLCP